GRGKNRLGGSSLAQTVCQTGEAPPDVDSAEDLKGFWNAIQQLGREGRILAYHDRSDGGIFACAAEMAFAGEVGLDIELPAEADPFAALFSEELGALLQIRVADEAAVLETLRAHGLDTCSSVVGSLNDR